MGLGCRLLSGRGGFTLLELLLVVTVLSAVAWMSLGVVSNNADQVRFEDTRNRLQAIRRAIIGDTSRTVNGGPEVRGYVADMGRLPPHLQALVVQEYCNNHPEITTNADDECTKAGGTWASQPGYEQDATTGIWSGWNGPYLSPGFGSTGRYLDGWGRVDTSSHNFGWVFAQDSPNEGDLTIRSRGRDGVAGGGVPYDADYPSVTAAPLIEESEYRFKITESEKASPVDGIGGLRVDFGAAASCWVTEGCSKPSFNDKTTCVDNSGIWMGHCSNSSDETETACMSNGATWTWGGLCSNPSYTTLTACESNGETWRSYEQTWAKPRPRADITNSDDCKNETKTSATTGVWQPSKKLCMAMFVIKDGRPVQLVSRGFVEVQWDGTQKNAEFIFEDTTSATLLEDTYLYQGQMSWGIFEYDSSCQITKPFPAGSARWKNFTYVPGTTLQPFERKINP